MSALSSSSSSSSDSSSDFDWSQEYDITLERISSTDLVDVEWPKLRNIIKYKINQNIATFLADARSLQSSSIYVPPFSPRPSTNGGLKLPPFTSRERDESNPNEAPKVHYTAEEASAVKAILYAQLDGFDAAPFTIQRVADLCARPKENYIALGKYCRALEKALYVTSTWDSFPPLPLQPKDSMATVAVRAGLSSSSAPTTPLFSPISFLHDDARRSHSRSPPPSPLNLNGTEAGITLDPDALGMEPRELGLVDELDDPNPGHLSDRPTALTSVTSIGGSSGVISLEDRFVRASDEGGDPEMKQQQGVDGSMGTMLDERDGDKENRS
ncbi:PPP4R2-domain-containing protein [Multifurca ochricompacta]|uniref:PPP4R2-domain-containing protein n=1 Tax=Multifurca ochricompacta TaxID=376703 RepID=A0AAD4MA59_9AGAM|nr:PPP4R2-domain-containing protein [Multifurca ochricompacta]